MNPAIYIPICMLWLIIFMTISRQRRENIIRIILQKRKHGEEKMRMKAIAEKFVGKECLIYTLNSQQVSGKIVEVTDGALLLDNGKQSELINFDYVVRIREYPTNKNGKKKSVVLD